MSNGQKSRVRSRMQSYGNASKRLSAKQALSEAVRNIAEEPVEDSDLLSWFDTPDDRPLPRAME